MYEVFIETSISSAHCLDGYPGPCARVHGHNWRIKAVVSCRELDERGFAVDFQDLKEQVEEICSRLDHRELNRLDAFRDENPTAENLARHIYRELSSRFTDGRIRIARVEVRETSDSGAVYRE
ncbi:MAG: 6-carboxytetrahydropterin synthase QueD [Candidatus Erginobacter occultus]|nr:6-carboxytetrahydropterin synthase QueD [Candidatus Erginobacter occultus]